MNKIGEERIFSIWWFVAIVAISAVIVLSVSGFYSKDIDSKKLEAKILYERIVECITDNGFLRSDFSKDFDLYKECNLKKEILSEEGLFYFSIKLGDSLIFNEGDNSLSKDCDVSTSNIKTKYFPGCINRKEDILILKEGKINSEILQVVVVSNQESKYFLAGEKNE